MLRGVIAILTIGHSNRTFEAFLECLRAHGVTRLIDIRTVPRSRHNPQFNRETLAETLPAAGISYAHLPGLGGLVSTTHTITGAIVGVGMIHRVRAVRWGLATSILWAWLFTIPAAAAIAAVSYWIIRALMAGH